jgi:hypothetical protein
MILTRIPNHFPVDAISLHIRSIQSNVKCPDRIALDGSEICAWNQVHLTKLATCGQQEVIHGGTLSDASPKLDSTV